MKYPLSNDILGAQCDVCWGPQDASAPPPNTNTQLQLFKSRSITGVFVYLQGPLLWLSKRQHIGTKLSQSQNVGTDECVKQVQHICNIIKDLSLAHILTPDPTTVKNDNSACIHWSNSMTTKNLRHLQLRENAVQELVHSKTIRI